MNSIAYINYANNTYKTIGVDAYGRSILKTPIYRIILQVAQIVDAPRSKVAYITRDNSRSIKLRSSAVDMLYEYRCEEYARHAASSTNITYREPKPTVLMGVNGLIYAMHSTTDEPLGRWLKCLLSR